MAGGERVTGRPLPQVGKNGQRRLQVVFSSHLLQKSAKRQFYLFVMTGAVRVTGRTLP